MNQTLAEKAYIEMHNHARHIITTLVYWFAFFVTVNFGTMGWLAAAGKAQLIHSFLIALSTLLAFQNALGIAICFVCRSSLRRLDTQIRGIASTFGGAASNEVIPEVALPWGLYTNAIWLMVAALISTFTVWILAPHFLQ